MTAQEARELTDQYLSVDNNFKYKEIYSEIKSHATIGEYKFLYYGVIPENVMNRLKTDGYNIRLSYDVKDSSSVYLIEW